MATRSLFSRPDDNGDALLAVALAAVGYLIAAWNLAALTWDGSWYLFHSLQDRIPFTPHHRYGTYPLTWLLIGLSGIIDNPTALGIVFGVLLALLPMASLALSWHYLRGQTLAPLRVWPALGILLAALPGQLCLISESGLAAQLLWPLLALVASGPRRFHDGACLLALAVLAALLHPTAVPILALVSLLFAARAWRVPWADSRTTWLWAGTFAMLSATKFWETLWYATGYEREQASLQAVRWQFHNAISGLPLAFLGLVYLLGFVLLGTGKFSLPASVFSRRLIWLLCLALALVGCTWAAEVTRWSGLLDYRRFVLPATLPLVLLGWWDYRRRVATPPRQTGVSPFLLCRVAAIFALVLAVQSCAWGHLLHDFARWINEQAAQDPFLYADSAPFTRRTPLRHWSAVPLSILLQGRRPHAVYVIRPESIRPGGMNVYPPDDIEFIDGWFALARLDQTRNAPDNR